MSRFTETEETVKKLNKNLISLFDDNELSNEEIFASLEAGTVNVLSEIALSLAMIADELEEKY